MPRRRTEEWRHNFAPSKPLH